MGQQYALQFRSTHNLWLTYGKYTDAYDAYKDMEKLKGLTQNVKFKVVIL